jgi:hypothetical protein
MERLSSSSIGAVALLILLCGGCTATVTYQHQSTDSTGVRYYESAPYLLVYSDGKGGLKWQIYYIPDQSHIMTATPIVRGGKAQMTLFFVNGALSSSTVAGDTTTIPNAILAAAQAVIPIIAAGVLAEKGEPPSFPKPYLYKIVVSGSSVEFRGGQGDATIRVPLQKGPGG